MVTFQIAYANTGPSTLQSLTIVDPLPMGATFVGASGGGVAAAGVVTWLLGDVPAGGTATVMVMVQLASYGTYLNKAIGTVTSGQTTPMVTSNTTSTSASTGPARWRRP